VSKYVAPVKVILATVVFVFLAEWITFGFWGGGSTLSFHVYLIIIAVAESVIIGPFFVFGFHRGYRLLWLMPFVLPLVGYAIFSAAVAALVFTVNPYLAYFTYHLLFSFILPYIVTLGVGFLGWKSAKLAKRALISVACVGSVSVGLAALAAVELPKVSNSLKTQALTTQNASLCAKIPTLRWQEKEKSKDCYRELARAKGDVTLCDGISGRDADWLRQVCRGQVAKETKNPKDCEHAAYRDSCLADIAIKDNDISKCLAVQGNRYDQLNDRRVQCFSVLIGRIPKPSSTRSQEEITHWCDVVKEYQFQITRRQYYPELQKQFCPFIPATTLTRQRAPKDWSTVETSLFAFALPPGWNFSTIPDGENVAGQIIGPDTTFTFSFGKSVKPIVALTNPQYSHLSDYVDLQSVVFSFLRFKTASAQGYTQVYFNSLPDNNKLALWGLDLTIAQGNLFDQIYRTISIKE